MTGEAAGVRLRTQDEIAERIRASRDDDFLGFRAEVLIGYLDFEHVRPFLKPDATPGEWTPDPLDEASVAEAARKYMDFAWDKARGHRGISAGRSIDKLTEWIWLLGRDDVVEAIELAAYEQYGVPKLVAICEAMGWPIPEGEDVKRMAQGLPCRPDGCDEGCGR